MSILTSIIGALTFRRETFTALRERSDVFYRGFLVILVMGLLVGAFAAGERALTRVFVPADEEKIVNNALAQFERSFSGPANLGLDIESYIREGISIGVEIANLPPRAGANMQPLVAALEWLGATLATPISFGFIGWTLLAGVVIHLTSRWFGGKAGIAQMLGLTSLAAAPQFITAIAGLLTLIGIATGVGAFSGLNGLLNLIMVIWSAAIYVFATSIAQQFSVGRSIGAVVVGFALIFTVIIALVMLIAFTIAALIAVLASGTR